MKKLLTLTAVGAILSTPAWAVKKCVQYGSGTTCTSTAANYLGKANWGGACTTSGNRANVYGVAACSSATADYTGVLYTDGALPGTDGSVTDIVNCWCKMTRPAESLWVFVYKGESVGDCAYNCAQKCAEALVDSVLFRNALFSSISH